MNISDQMFSLIWMLLQTAMIIQLMQLLNL
jgi:hypothetical protein